VIKAYKSWALVAQISHRGWRNGHGIISEALSWGICAASGGNKIKQRLAKRLSRRWLPGYRACLKSLIPAVIEAI